MKFQLNYGLSFKGLSCSSAEADAAAGSINFMTDADCKTWQEVLTCTSLATTLQWMLLGPS